MRKRRRTADEASGRKAGSGAAARTPAGTESDAAAGRKRGVVCVGEIAGAFGVRGEVRLKSYCERPEAIADYSPLASGDGREFRLAAVRSAARGVAARIEGVGTREEAQALKGVMLYAKRSRFAETEDDEFYQADLIGASAYGLSGKLIGTVSAVHCHGAGDILEIADADGTRLVPFTRDAVPDVVMAESRIVVDESLL